MPSFRLTIITSAVILGIFTNASFAASEKLLTAVSVNKHIDEVGAKEALHEYWSSKAFWQILDGIGTADPEWLKVYSRLRPVSDAGASEDLSDAIYNVALANKPFKVIALVQEAGWNVESICTFEFEAQCPPDGIWPYLNRLEKNLNKAKTNWEKSVKKTCMKGIRAAKIVFPKQKAVEYCPKENQ